MERDVKAPNCPEHGRLVLDLARGRLDDVRASDAERVLDTCPVCSAWWSTHLEGHVADAVDQAVDRSFAAFSPPQRRRVSGWMPAAAAVLLLVGAGLLWSPGDRAPAPADHPTGSFDVARESFDGDIDGDGIVGVSDLGLRMGSEPTPKKQPRSDKQSIFDDGVDSGDLANWSSRT
jgi:hypothetical protein